MSSRGLFIGRATIDIVSLVARFPSADEKIWALSQTLSPGGPALNASVAFAALGGSSRLCSSVGMGLYADIIRRECADYSIDITDFAESIPDRVPVSVVVSSAREASRCIINAPLALAPVTREFPAPPSEPPSIVLLDQFEPDAVAHYGPALRSWNVPIVVDAGSWKAQSPSFMRLATIPIVSSRFLAPGLTSRDEMIRYLNESNFERWAITAGADGVFWGENGNVNHLAAIPVQVVDTLGAGDIFHGAFSYAFANGQSFAASLEFANGIAAESCKYLGTREWIRGRIGSSPSSRNA